MTTTINWRRERCAYCDKALDDSLLMLVRCIRQPDGGIGIDRDPVTKVCSIPCLIDWARRASA